MHREPETYAQKMNRLANKQMIEDIDRERRKLERKRWWNTHVGGLIQYLLVGCLVLLFTSFIILIIGE